MKMNMGYVDRTVRIVGGILILGLITRGNEWGLIGLFPFLTGIIGVCPIYSMTGAETASDDENRPK